MQCCDSISNRQRLKAALIRHFSGTAEEAAEKNSLMSSRAKRGIFFFSNLKKKADCSGKPRPRNDTFGIFP
jgi:hypothetical protein